jgi:5-methylcytosine-specific restriction protein A
MPSKSPTFNPLARVQHLTRRAQLVTRAEFQRMYWGRWRRASARYLAEHPFCVRCELVGLVTPATVTDHAIPHRGDDRLFWDAANWQPLCKLCHDRKTATEDGGFGLQPTRERAPDDVMAAYAEYCASAGLDVIHAHPEQARLHVTERAGDRARRTAGGRRAPRRRGGRTPTGGEGSNVQTRSVTSRAPTKKTRTRNWIKGGTIETGGRSALVDWWNRIP